MPLPARSTISNFDGDNKINGLVPPANQALDWDNPSLASATSDVAALGQTAPRFWCRFTLAATTGALVLNNWKANWGNVTTTAPTLIRVRTGVFAITVPTVVSDEYDASVGITNNITVNFSAAQAAFESTSTFGFINPAATGNQILICTANSSASASDMVGITVSVVAY